MLNRRAILPPAVEDGKRWSVSEWGAIAAVKIKKPA
jgi:hypothetical protein